MRFVMIRLVLVLAAGALLLPAGTGRAQGIDTRANIAILVDVSTGTVLFEKNPDQRMPTASMSKVMTIYMVFQALEEGRLSLDDTLRVSERAWRIEGSRMWAEVNSRISVEDLIRGVIVQSGNDAAIVLAEGLAGSEEAFAQRMTEQAHALGMTDSSFRNATGLPDPDHYSTARDLVRMSERLIEDFPQYYHYYSEMSFTYNNILQENRNPLLGTMPGADGLKTGHTSESGYSLIGTAERDGRRLIVVVAGLSSEAERGAEAERILEWGFREFETYVLFRAGETVEEAETWMGSPGRVPLTLTEDLTITMRRTAREQMRVLVRVDEPVPAPIEAGQPVATLVIEAPDMPVREVTLVAASPVGRMGFLGRIGNAVGHLIFGGGA